MAKISRGARSAPIEVRMRRAYFDCRYGQLHVRTAFPTSGGFNEATTLLCLHATDANSRQFQALLPQIAADRSVYALDLPGCGESDAPAGVLRPADHALALEDFAADLRLRQFDVIGLAEGAAIAVELAIAQSASVRRLVLIDGVFPAGTERLPEVSQPTLLWVSAAAEAATAKYRSLLRQARTLSLPAPWTSALEQDAPTLAAALRDFLS